MAVLYDIFMGNKSVGKASVEVHGLYYRFDCTCHIPKGKLYRLVVSCGDVSENLGVCVPKANTFGMETRLPIKRLGRGDLSFRVITNDGSQKDIFIPIHETEPFAYISKLDNAHLVFADGNYGILVNER